MTKENKKEEHLKDSEGSVMHTGSVPGCSTCTAVRLANETDTRSAYEKEHGLVSRMKLIKNVRSMMEHLDDEEFHSIYGILWSMSASKTLYNAACASREYETSARERAETQLKSQKPERCKCGHTKEEHLPGNRERCADTPCKSFTYSEGQTILEGGRC